MKSIYYLIKRYTYSIKNRILIIKCMLRYDRLMIGPGALLKFRTDQSVIFGNNVYIGAYTYIEQGANHSTNVSSLIIGSNTYIGEFNNLRAVDGSIRIGENCLVSQQVSIIASNHNTSSIMKNISDQGVDLSRCDIEIMDDVWIGANCVILPGSVIGKGCVIAAGSVVRGILEKNSVYAGVPARFIKMRAL
jgi:acetyltransferase-like isoleucine patch superfamily enzyme